MLSDECRTWLEVLVRVLSESAWVVLLQLAARSCKAQRYSDLLCYSACISAILAFICCTNFLSPPFSLERGKDTDIPEVVSTIT